MSCMVRVMLSNKKKIYLHSVCKKKMTCNGECGPLLYFISLSKILLFFNILNKIIFKKKNIEALFSGVTFSDKV